MTRYYYLESARYKVATYINSFQTSNLVFTDTIILFYVTVYWFTHYLIELPTFSDNYNGLEYVRE